MSVVEVRQQTAVGRRRYDGETVSDGEDFKLPGFSQNLMEIDGSGLVRLATTRRIDRWWSAIDSYSDGGESTINAFGGRSKSPGVCVHET
ncbi:UNVERIFIED_CONTAM: hypothetical protein Sradi_4094000 [Sesamum radiatum]|uniref:Uncharacterized protein n=1 Tax=Sesamum radiatum TaxID=300843 RepID=A0AAW2PPL0_SESRA